MSTRTIIRTTIIETTVEHEARRTHKPEDDLEPGEILVRLSDGYVMVTGAPARVPRWVQDIIDSED